ncbi:hypothetical protein CSUI_011566, partial [Cystoisospora suis]
PSLSGGGRQLSVSEGGETPHISIGESERQRRGGTNSEDASSVYYTGGGEQHAVTEGLRLQGNEARGTESSSHRYPPHHAGCTPENRTNMIHHYQGGDHETP